jgi:hypothetical protein
VPLSLALTDHLFLVFPRQMNIQIPWTMVVHELATVNLILSPTETVRRLNNIRQLQQPLFQSIDHGSQSLREFLPDYDSMGVTL